MVPALFVALVTFGLVKTTEPKAVVGSAAPEFSLHSLDGSGRISSRDLKGAPVVVNFWASWCVSCPEEAAVLEEMWQEYGPKGVRFLGVTFDDGAEAGRAFVEQYGVTYPSVRDPDQYLASRLGVRAVPETFFIDQDWTFAGSEAAQQIGTRNGTVVRGPVSATVLRSHLDALLDEWAKARGR